MEGDKGRNENFRRGRVQKICSWQLVDMLLKTPRLQCTALTAENEMGLSLGFCCVAVIAGWDDEALLSGVTFVNNQRSYNASDPRTFVL
jgi:hypothetical protein